ncbi:dynein axonemal heavy chain 14-like [Thomomys bottae]
MEARSLQAEVKRQQRAGSPLSSRMLACFEVQNTGTTRASCTRWQETIHHTESKLEATLGDMLLAAACIVYSGALTPEFRQLVLRKWESFSVRNNISPSSGFSLLDAMAPKYEVQRWHSQGLPLGRHSAENAVLIRHSQQWPLLIDPHKQAQQWIRQLEGPRLHELSLEDSSYLRKMKHIVKMGGSVLLRDLPETLPAGLKSILKKDIHRKRWQHYIRIEDSETEYNVKFRLYLTTDKDNPHFLPSVSNFVTMVNFTLTFHSLQDQLLSLVVSHEEPHLEKQRSQLLERISVDTMTLEEMEGKTLNLLQKTQGCILDNEEIVETLRKCKVTSREISKRIKATEKAEREMQATRARYLPVATRGTLLYFLVASLSKLNYMYQFSLAWFRKIFIASVISNREEEETGMSRDTTTLGRGHRISGVSAPPEPDHGAGPRHLRTKRALDALTRNVFKVISAALFNRHKLCISFLLCTTIMRNNTGKTWLDEQGFLPEEEWNAFLYSGILVDMKSILPSPGLDNMFEMYKNQHLRWLSSSGWKQSQYISMRLAAFETLCQSLLSNVQQWEQFRSSQTPYSLLGLPFSPRHGSSEETDALEQRCRRARQREMKDPRTSRCSQDTQHRSHEGDPLPRCARQLSKCPKEEPGSNSGVSEPGQWLLTGANGGGGGLPSGVHRDRKYLPSPAAQDSQWASGGPAWALKDAERAADGVPLSTARTTSLQRLSCPG